MSTPSSLPAHELPPVFVTPLEAGRILSLSRSEVYHLLNVGLLQERRHGVRRLVVLESVYQFAQQLPA